MTRYNRRKFIAATAGAASLLAARAAHAADSPPAPPQVPLGRTGIQLSRVAQGTGMHGGKRQSDHTRMGFQKLGHLLRHSFERGITFFDMADLYGTHIYFRDAMKGIDRDRYAVLTKIWWRYDGKTVPQAEPWRKQVCAATLERFRHELVTDYLDIVLLHCMQTPDWPHQLEPYMDAMQEAKAKGQIKAVGVSCHNFDALKVAASHPWVDVILARVNPVGVKAKMDASTAEVVGVLKQIKQNGKAVIGMKILGEGKLADQKERCIQFAQGLGLLDAMTIGFEEPGHVDEILHLMHKYPAAPMRT